MAKGESEKLFAFYRDSNISISFSEYYRPMHFLLAVVRFLKKG